MTKLEAMLYLMSELKAERLTQKGLRGSIQACRTLGLEDEEIPRILRTLEYMAHDGKVWNEKFAAIIAKAGLPVEEVAPCSK